jgi:3-hydroxymyristoyl/3-hydroxydecanoyl-(acyl carrier protein) dehydratase
MAARADAAPALPIPHRPPFLFVTQVVDTSEDGGRFSYEMPRHGDSFALRMFPELLTLEAMAQAAAAFHGLREAGQGDEHGLLAALDRVRFSGQASPGDVLDIRIRCRKVFGELVLLDAEVWVQERKISEAEIVVRRGIPETA